MVTTYTYDGDGHTIGVSYSGDGGSTGISKAYDEVMGVCSRAPMSGGKTTTYSYASDGSDKLIGETGPGGLYSKTMHYNSNFDMDYETLQGPDGLGGSYSQTIDHTYEQASCCGALPVV